MARHDQTLSEIEAERIRALRMAHLWGDVTMAEDWKEELRAASAQANLGVDPERSILLAIEAAEQTRRRDGTVLTEAQQALHDALATSRVLSAVSGVGRRTGIGRSAGRIGRADWHVGLRSDPDRT